MVEQILRDCARQGGLKAVALRYFNASGADAEGDIGEARDPETHLLPLALGAAQGKVRHSDLHTILSTAWGWMERSEQKRQPSASGAGR